MEDFQVGLPLVDYDLGVGGFWKAKPYKERANFYAC